MMSVVGCCWTFAVLLYTIWPTGLEGIDSITFKETKPVTVLLGSNVTFNWTYSGQGNQTLVILFSFLRDGVLKPMAYYILGANVSITLDLGGYCDNVEWVGNTTKKIAAFRMNDISKMAHEETFAVEIYSRLKVNGSEDRQKIFILVPPKVHLDISNTNVASGDDTTIECEVIQGRPAPIISWYHNGKILTGKTGKCLLKIKKVQQENAGTYKCLAINNVGTSSSMVVNVTVYRQPTAAHNISIRFEGTKPKTVSVGSNIILNWTYSETVDKVMIINFGIWDSGFESLSNMARFLADTNKLEIVNVGKYCDTVQWRGEATKNVAAFKMNNISKLVDGKTFGIEFYFGPQYTSQKDLRKISLSGERNNGKRSTDVNAYAVFGIMVGFWSVFSSWVHVDSM